MNKTRAEKIVAQLLANAVDLKYGSVSVTVKFYNGMAVSVSYMTTNQTREQEIEESKNQ